MAVELDLGITVVEETIELAVADEEETVDLEVADDEDTDLEMDGVQVVEGGAGTSDHAKLTNRDAADQHPISAITGLQEALDSMGGGSPGGSSYEIGHGLKVEDNTLCVDTVNDFEGDNTLPITAAAVQTTVGNIELLLATI